jgi:hypothetical protein
MRNFIFEHDTLEFGYHMLKEMHNTLLVIDT